MKLLYFAWLRDRVGMAEDAEDTAFLVQFVVIEGVCTERHDRLRHDKRRYSSTELERPSNCLHWVSS